MHSILVQCLFASTKPSSQIFSPLNTAPVTARNDDGIFGPTVEAQTNHHTNLAARTETNPLQRWDTVSRSDGRVIPTDKTQPFLRKALTGNRTPTPLAPRTTVPERTGEARELREEEEEEGGGVEVEDAAAEQQ